MSLLPYLKAFAGAAVAGLSVAAKSVADHGSLHVGDYLYIAIATLTGLGAVYSVSNTDGPVAPAVQAYVVRTETPIVESETK